LKRGEIWTAADRAAYAGKPRPVVIVQDDDFLSLESVTICGLTSDPAEIPFFRVAVEPSESNGLEDPCSIMVDKALTLPKAKLRYRIGELSKQDIVRLNAALRLFLGLLG
jgi:mRNA interferase MazF